MSKQYQSDLDDDEPEDEPGLRLIALACCVLFWCLVAVAASADESGEGPCIPTVTDYESAYAFAGDDFAVIWWCPEERGLAAYWWTDTVRKSNPAAVFRLAGRDPDEFRRQLDRRWSTVDQITLAMQTQHYYGPRCYAGQTQVSCLSWRTVDGKRMCETTGQIQADGSRLTDSWAACELRKAPHGGWIG